MLYSLPRGTLNQSRSWALKASWSVLLSAHGVTTLQTTRPDPEMSVVNNPSLIEAVFLLFYVAVITSMPITEQYIYARFLGKDEASNFSDGVDYCANRSNVSDVLFENKTTGDTAETIAQKRTSQLQLILSLCGSIPALFAIVVLGSYSDVRGRKLVAALPLFGGIIRVAVTMIVMSFKLSLSLLIPAYLVEGVCGSSGVFNVAVFAILADITKGAKDRGRRLAIVESISGLAISASMISVGYLIKAVGFFLPLVVVISLLLVNFIAVIFLLPETVVPVPGAKILTLKNVKRTLNVYKKSEPHFRRRTLFTCLAVMVLIEPAFKGKHTVETLYVLRSPLCWESVKIGIYGGTSCAIQMVVVLAAIKPLQKFFSTLSIIIIGVISGLASLILESFATVDFVMFLVPVVGMFVMFPIPLLRSHMSVTVDKDEQGAMFSGISLVQMTTTSVVQTVLNAAYMATVAGFPGFVFILCAIMSVPALAILIYLRHRIGREPSSDETDNAQTTTSTETDSNQ